jgi:hypothetical protein
MQACAARSTPRRTPEQALASLVDGEPSRVGISTPVSISNHFRIVIHEYPRAQPVENRKQSVEREAVDQRRTTVMTCW